MLKLILLVSLAHAQSFWAAEYFATHETQAERMKLGFPDRVHIDPIELTAEQATEILVGTWRTQVSCSGRAPLLKQVVSRPLANGLTTPSVTVKYDENGVFERILLRGTRDPIGAARIIDVSGQWKIISRPTGLSLETMVWDDHELRFAKIRETGEIVFFTLGVHANPCEENEIYQIIRSKVPVS